jgi:DNA-binding transcriptional MerR regulator
MSLTLLGCTTTFGLLAGLRSRQVMADNRHHGQAKPALDIGSVIAAFSEEQVERMTGLSKGRLRYWAQTDFFRPSFVEENPRLPFSRFYSFKDVVALRTLEILRVRHSVPLQQLRKVAAKLSHLQDSLWTQTKLFVVNKEVCFVNPETSLPESVLDGQRVFDVLLGQVIQDTHADVVAFGKRRPGTAGQLTRSRNVIRNAWVVAGTRVPVSAIKRLHEDGFTARQIIGEYPDLTIEDVEAALHQSGQQAA